MDSMLSILHDYARFSCFLPFKAFINQFFLKKRNVYRFFLQHFFNVFFFKIP